MHADDGPFDSAPSTDWQSGPTHIWATLSHHRLRELLTEVQDRVEDIVVETRDRMDALLDAVVAVSSGLELDSYAATDRSGRYRSGRMPDMARSA